METSANSAGFKLELQLIILFLVYVAYLILSNLRKRRQLTSEKVRLSGIVEGLVPLFARLVIIEPEQQRYEYLKGAPPNLPAKGAVAELKHYMSPRYLYSEEENPSPILRSLEEIAALLSEGTPFLQYEHRILWDKERWENTSVLSTVH